MERLEALINWLKRWQYLGIAVIVVASFVLHMGLIMRPAEPLFDEVHYVNDARYFLETGDTNREEHVPLGKLLVAGGIQLFGDNPIGWRLIAILMGTASVLLFYLICRRLKLPEAVCYLATFFFAFENLTFVHGHIAMLDGYSQFFLLLSFWLYLRGNYAVSAVAVALSALAKLTGALGIVAIGIHWLLYRCPDWKRFIPSMMLAPIAFLGLLPVFELAYWGELKNPIARSIEMLELAGSITFAEYEPGGIASRPWEWIFTVDILPYWWTPRFLGMISPTLWVLIVPSVIYMTVRSLKGEDAPLFPFAWFIALYLLWVPTSLITDRASHIFYFYPTVGAIALVMGMIFGKLIEISRKRHKGKLRLFLKIIIPLYLVGHLVAFIIIAPPSMWWSVPVSIFVYFFSFFYLGLGSTPYPEPEEPVPLLPEQEPAQAGQAESA